MIAGLLSAALIAGAAAEPFAWPLDRPRVLTSSFAEYRPGRFHAGIDLRTGGIGLPVMAAGDGHVSRVRCSPHGYGKAVYLQLDSGHNVVYAHLDDFADELRDYVRQLQHAAQDYTVDAQPPPGRFRVRRGEVIAFSGQTGIGAPHLHFEFREGDAPVNPRLLGLDWPDSTRPTIQRVAIVPRPPSGRVNGDVYPVVLEAQALGGGAYRVPPVRITGAFAVGADFIDPVEGGAKLGARTLRVLDGDHEAFHLRHDRLDYADSHNAAVAYHPHLLDRGRFLMGFRWPGNRCASYSQSAAEGWLVADAARDIHIEVTDFHGNAATVQVPVEAAGTALVGSAPDEATAASTSLETHGNALLVTWRANGPVAAEPAVDVTPPAAVSTLRVDDRTVRAVVVPSQAGPHQITLTHPRLGALSESAAVFLRGRAGIHEAHGVRVHVAKDSAYGMLLARVTPLETPPSSPVPGRGKAFRIWPEDAPVDAPVRVALPLPHDVTEADKADIYRHTGKHWVRESSRREGGMLVAETRRLGIFRVLEDARAPYLGDLNVAEGAQFTSRRPRIVAGVRDVGSGIAQVDGHCGDDWLLMAYDPEADRMTWEADRDLPSGPRILRLRARDHAGNVTEITRNVTVP